MNKHKVDRPSLGARTAFNRGKKLHISGNYSEGANKFQEAITRAPNWVEPRMGLADSLRRLGDIRQSIHVAFTILDARPVSSIGVRYLSGMLHEYGDQDIDTFNLEGCSKALELNDVDTQPLVYFALKFMMRRPPLSTALQMGRDQSWDKAVKFLVYTSNMNFLNNRLFNLCLCRGINKDHEFELLLTGIRKLFAERSSTSEIKSLFLQSPNFFASLIQQCINNEFVFYVTEDERQAVERLQFGASLLLSGSSDAMRSLAIASMYEPLKNHFKDTLDLKELNQQKPTEVSTVWVNELDRIFDERKRLVEIPSFGLISNKISKEVADQYEENPYPRWVFKGLNKNERLFNDLREMFGEENLEYKKIKRTILIAGCGTGWQVAITAAEIGSMADITAIDLSRNSLAYAERKIEEYGFNNVTFLHGDILDLPTLEQQFDVIICTGVLHHMADPLAGWQILTDHLSSGGAMNIALYSAVARKQKNELLSQINLDGDAVTDEKVRLFRHKILTDRLEDWVNIVDKFTDFYSLSGCRDLFFHAQESEYSIRDIENHLSKMGLIFLRFNLPIFHTSKFDKLYPGNNDRKNLELWNQFEHFNPDTFTGMYNFWCMKP